MIQVRSGDVCKVFPPAGASCGRPFLLVLALSEPSDSCPGFAGFVRVAQISHDMAMMDEGDVLLDGEHGFAEAWNAYGLPADALEAFAHAGAEAAARTLALADGDFPALDPAGALFRFRMREAEAGARISLPLNMAALDRMESAGS